VSSKGPREPEGTEHDVVLRPADQADRPSLLKELLTTLQDEGLTVGKIWTRGKAEAERGKAFALKALAIARIQKVEVDQQRVENERRHADRQAKLDEEKAANDHAERMYELETQRIQAQAEALSAIVAATLKLREAGVEVKFGVVDAAQFGVGLSSESKREAK
jgi:hypothetical protein